VGQSRFVNRRSPVQSGPPAPILQALFAHKEIRGRSDQGRSSWPPLAYSLLDVSDEGVSRRLSCKCTAREFVTDQRLVTQRFRTNSFTTSLMVGDLTRSVAAASVRLVSIRRDRKSSIPAWSGVTRIGFNVFRNSPCVCNTTSRNVHPSGSVRFIRSYSSVIDPLCARKVKARFLSEPSLLLKISLCVNRFTSRRLKHVFTVRHFRHPSYEELPQ
jgi:hypothetical protein